MFPSLRFSSSFRRHMNLGSSSKGFFSTEQDPGKVEGTNLRVLKYPHPLLRAKNAEITVFDDSLKKVVEEMFLVMYAADGIGLAAPQVGINKRLMVFNEEGEADKKEKEMALINPVIVAASENKILSGEGCLSFPTIRGRVERNDWIEVEYQTPDGTKTKTKLTGAPAIIFQHEYDHLDGVLFIDRLIGTDRERVERKLDRLIKKHGPGGAI
eukprot:gene5853-6445_t